MCIMTKRVCEVFPACRIHFVRKPCVNCEPGVTLRAFALHAHVEASWTNCQA